MKVLTPVRDRIAALAAEHPDYTNLQIARIIGCNATYVGRVRPGGSPREPGQHKPYQTVKVNLSLEYGRWVTNEAKKIGCKPSDIVRSLVNDAIAEAMEAGQ